MFTRELCSNTFESSRDPSSGAMECRRRRRCQPVLGSLLGCNVLGTQLNRERAHLTSPNVLVGASPDQIRRMPLLALFNQLRSVGAEERKLTAIMVRHAKSPVSLTSRG